ncbi:hypothetical protein BS639_05685 [Rouxiella silvae]|uniref:Ketoacyl-ACP synthase III family protein n=1 Tax=Rouxiella silvae TaxID=1646373 RepID=A0AA40X3E0_9GAMM|nr:ketoacyl-ACP synthase III family protein [Rouxiella silvae]MBF6637810.1 ketoacyl-ACP synthase III family protein [Rouxiella silvae]ORJ22136.1 hypothetical protein BS639_05685 [Rouxiella silvae]
MTRAGIIAFETVIPPGNVSRQDIARLSGVDAKELEEILPAPFLSVFDTDKSDWEYATEAARRVLDQKNVAASQLDWIIYCGSGVWDKPFWSPAAKVAEQLGATQAHCFEVVNFCNAGATGIAIATGWVNANPEKTALVIICDRLSGLIDHADSASRALFNFGDSATALLVGVERPLLTLSACDMQTDPTWCDMYQGEYRQGRVFARKNYTRKGLLQVYVEMLSQLLDRSLSKTSLNLLDIRFLLINQGDINVHNALLTRLALPSERSVFNYHANGHLGGGDNWIALRQLLKTQRLQKGDMLAMATSAMGFSWGISLFEVTR